MGLIKRLFTLFSAGLILAMVAAAIGALAARRRSVPAADPDADEVALRAIFEPIHFESRATAFRGGTIECWYGGGVIDLRKATLDKAGARLEIRTTFGGGQVIVPESWNVTSHVIGIGGVGDTRARVARDPDAPHLAIDGYALFGGLAIMSDVPEDELRGLDEQIRRWAQRRPVASNGEATPGTEPGPAAAG
jgi:hypothetical protein